LKVALVLSKRPAQTLSREIDINAKIAPITDSKSRFEQDLRLSQADAPQGLGVTQPKVSALRHYKLAGFSVERSMLTALDRDVEIVIRRRPV
jgi:predicted XRE-type DNA-binding protein